ncbi:MAG: DUF3488 domain-containing protein [Planctomycetes bacterium]|nr:DUF3488 domain-containing protein [Planctomycetota bacterium]
MNLARHGDVIYGTLARVSGLALVLVTVAFQRRGVMHWTELVFLGLCIGLQESFLRLSRLRRYRTPMLVAYSMLPLALIGLRADEIAQFRGRFVPLVVETPLPLVFVSIQIMVLYLRESQRLTSVVLVLALFSTVIGVRRQLTDPLWPWLGAICAATTLFLFMQHPGMLFANLLHSLSGRPTTQTQGARPAGAIRPGFAALAPLLVLSTVIGAGVLFFVLPRPRLGTDAPTAPGQGGGPGEGPGQGRGRPGQGQGQGSGNAGDAATMSGLADGVTLGDFGTIQLDRKPAMTLRRVGTHSPPSIEVYMRVYTFGRFDGERWLPLSAEDAPRYMLEQGVRRDLSGAPSPGGAGFNTRSYEVTIRQGAWGTKGELPVPVEPRSVSGIAGPLTYGTVDHVLRAPQLKPDSIYRVESTALVATPGDLQATLAGKVAAGDGLPADYLALPADLPEKLRKVFRYQGERGQDVALFDELNARANARNPRDPPARRGAYATAARIVELFNRMTVGPEKAWKYSLEFRPLPGPDGVVRFLDLSSKGERFGHCEYFASAMTVLLRCFGIPARLCAGFMARKPDVNGVYEVTFANAHAWVEAWLPGYGWVTFDPTPGQEQDTTSEPTPTDAEGTPEDPTGPDTALDPEEPEPDVFTNFGGREQEQLMQLIQESLEAAFDWTQAMLALATAWMPPWVPGNPWLRAGLLVVPPGSVLLAWFLLGRRKRRRVAAVLGEAPDDSRKRERGLYAQLLLLLARHGFQKVPSETPREFAQRVLAKGGEVHADLPALTQMYYAFRFGSRNALVEDFKRGVSQYAARLKTYAQSSAAK